MEQQQQTTEAIENVELDNISTPKDLRKKKRSRDTEREEERSSDAEASVNHPSKKNLLSHSPPPELVQEGERVDREHTETDTNEQPMDIGSKDKEGFKEGDNSDEMGTKQTQVMHSHTAPPPMGPAQWEQIMSRFDSFEKSIQTTIKEEIKINSVNMQKQMKSLNSKVKVVETSISANKTEIEKLNQKVANFDNIQEIIAAEVQKQTSKKITSLEKDLEESKAEISALKKAKTPPPSKEPNSSDHVSRQEFLMEKYFNRKRNLLIMGVEESKEGEDEKNKVAEILQKRLNIPRVKLEMAFRMGATVGKYPRPILVTFSNLAQRYQIWYKKGALNKDQTEKLWLQEDFPKPLRNEMNSLLKIQKIAKSLPNKYPDVKIKDFKIRIQGCFYNAQQLETLPDDLKPSRSATPQNEEAVVFFGRASPLSNHHICSFTIAGRTFTCVEHFLAWQRANIAEDKALAEEVLQMKDPSEHKKTLNELRDKKADEWEDTVESVLLAALRAKFKQNNTLSKFLCDTHPRKIGEASINVKWGIGMSLTNDEVLDFTKWKAEGNRLGKALEVVRNELLQEQA